MIDFPVTDLFDDSLCLVWLERHLHPDGIVCPDCGSADRRHFRIHGHYAAYRCRTCDGYYTLLSGTAFEGSRQRPATLVLLLRGITKGEPTARLAHELHLARQTVHTLRQRLQTNLNDNAPTETMDGQTFEVDELYQNAGGKVRRIATWTICPAAVPGTLWVKQPGHGTYNNEGPPILHIISPETGEERCSLVGHSDKATCQGILAEAVPPEGTIVYSDEYQSYHGIEPQHATVNHSQHEWARDDDGDGVREVHCNSCEGAGAALRSLVRPFRGVHKAYLQFYVATYEALVNAKRVSPTLICRMCWPPKQPPHAYWT